MIKTFHAWAIDTRSKEGHGFIGRYWSFGDVTPVIPAHMEGYKVALMGGYKVALFKTRREARQAAKEIRESKCSDGSKWSPFPEVRAVKVEVLIVALTGKGEADHRPASLS